MKTIESFDAVYEIDGFDVIATIKPDYDHGAPWKNEDGHGPVSEWTRRDKRAGELVLSTDIRAGSKRYYDYAEACKIARRDGWLSAADAKRLRAGEAIGTPKERASRAAMADYDRLCGWCAGLWGYCGVVVIVFRAGVELGSASVWGIEDDAGDYLLDAADDCLVDALDDARARIRQLVA